MSAGARHTPKEVTERQLIRKELQNILADKESDYGLRSENETGSIVYIDLWDHGAQEKFLLETLESMLQGQGGISRNDEKAVATQGGYAIDEMNMGPIQFIIERKLADKLEKALQPNIASR